jgi:hypothetical protein
MDTGDPDRDKAKDRREDEDEAAEITRLRNEGAVRRVEKHPELFDFYDEFDEHAVTPEERKKFQKFLDDLTDREKEVLKETRKFYVASFRNAGGLVMPLILQLNYTDNTEEIIRIPAEIWRYDNDFIQKLLVTEKEIASIEQDPYNETGDIDTDNNRFPRAVGEKRFKVKPEDEGEKNPMQKAKEREEEEDDAAEAEEERQE